MKRKLQDMELLEKLSKMRKVIRKKYQALKTGKMRAENILEETLKPITEPLGQISKKIKMEVPEHAMPIKHEQIKDDFNTPSPFKPAEAGVSSTPATLDTTTRIDASSTPLSSRQRRKLQRSQVEEDSANESFTPGKQFSNTTNLHKSLTDIFGSPLNPKEIDSKYGIRYDSGTDSLKIGNASITIDDKTLRFKDKTYHLTPGLYKLIILRDPKSHMYTEEDLRVYGEILSYTNAYRRNYDPNRQVQAGRSTKYKNIIKNLITYHSGKSLMNLPKENIDYIYWNDPNELVDRLRLLIASQQAGNTNHNNEIAAIIEELREADIIE